MRSTIATLPCLIALVAGCATRPTSRYPELDSKVLGEETDPALAARLDDELTGLTPVEVRSEDGVLSGSVLAKGRVRAAKAVRGYMVDVDLGEAGPMSCTVQEGVLGLGAFTRALADAFLASHEAHEIKYAFAGTNGNLPYLVVHGQYVDGGSERRTGFLKMVVAGHGELTVACFHDRFGYRETVERVALSLAQDLRWKRDKALLPLVRRSVYALSKDGQPAGSREVVIRVDEEDFRRSWIRTAYLSLEGPRALHARDVVEIYDSDPDGRVHAQTHEVREDGKVRVDLKLQEEPMTDYVVSGHVDEDPVQSRFTLPEGLPDLMSSGVHRKAERAFSRFLPGVSPKEPTPTRVEKSASGYRVVSGEVVITGELDATGDWVRGAQSDGYTFERTALEP